MDKTAVKGNNEMVVIVKCRVLSVLKRSLLAFLSFLFILAGALIPHTNAEVIKIEDVPVDAWYWSNVQTAYKLRIFNGIGQNKFGPDNMITRAEFVTVIGRIYERFELSAEIETTTTNYYIDVDSASYYGKYVNWATANGIVTGYGDNRFGPNDYITREQMALIIYKYIKVLDVNLKGDPMFFLDFHDFTSISNWARDSIDYLRGYKIIQGSNGYFYPANFSTRAEAAAVCVRLCELSYDYGEYA